MRRLLLIFFVFPVVIPAFSQQECLYNKRSCLFGERAAEMPAPRSNVIRIFMDKEGYYYPEMRIKDAELKNSCSSLKEWYRQNPQKLDALCGQYHISIPGSTEERIEWLNDSVATALSAQINAKAASVKRVDVLIHGFRKKAYGKKDGISTYSTDDNEKFEKELPGNDSVLFLEIYWDGKFITPLKAYRYKGLELFEKAAIPDAEITGLHLRKVIGAIRCRRINIITHSLGAQVGCELLFNASPGLKKEEALYGTPSQEDIRLCLIEPAIGAGLFDSYYSRTTSYNYRAKDNYRLGIVYNENDFVLLKSYHMGIFSILSSPPDYGDTSLGCNYKGCIVSLKKLFADNYPHSRFEEPFNFSGLGADHRLYRYSRYKGFSAVKKFLDG
jgi:hypothetical protein